MIELIKSAIIERWFELGLNRPSPRKIDFLKFNFHRYTYELGSFNFLFFFDDETKPTLFGKMKRNFKYNELIENEYRNIKYFSEKIRGGLGKPFPSLVGLINIREHCLLLEETIHLPNLLTKNCPQKTQSHSDRVIDWIAEFHGTTKSTDCPISLVSYLLNLITLFEEGFVLNENELAFMRELKSKIQTLSWDGWKLVHTHGDLGPRNVLINDFFMKVLDWELSERFGPPVYDVIKFLFRIYFAMETIGSPTEGFFCRLISGKDEYSDLFRNQIDNYLNALGLPAEKEFVQFWVEVFLLKMATAEYQFFGKHFYEDNRWRGVLQAYLRMGKPFVFS
jgi:thiamine kinase-like enzyme